MVDPEYICDKSLMDNKVKVTGNIQLADRIKELTKLYIKQNKDLYTAEETIKNLLINKFGNEWYDKSGEAINFIIENEYANIERRKLPSFNMKQYEYDMKNSVMY